MTDQKPSHTVAEDPRGTLQLMHHVPEEARPMGYSHRDTLLCPWDPQREVFCMPSMWKADSGESIMGNPAEN